MRRPSRRARAEAGFTLVELLLAVSILGIGVVAVVGGMMTSIQVSDLGRRQADGQTALRAYAEAVAGAGYTKCATGSTYTPSAVGFTVPTGYTAASTVSWFDNNSGAFDAMTCTAATDKGLQRVTLRIAADDGRASESVAIAKRTS